MTSKTPIQADGDALVQAVQDSVKTQVIAVDDLNYVTRQVFLPPGEPTSNTLALHTLTGIVDYLNDGPDERTGAVIHIHGYDRVEVIGPEYGRGKQRDTYVVASCDNVLGRTFSFGQFYDAETFNIVLQSLFVQTDEREAVLRVVGNIKEETVKQTGDDGVSQTVTARAGIARVAEVAVPNPVTLQPFRTFREIEQPASVFILRMRQNNTGLPSCALFEADGGAWKLRAIQGIKAWLEERTDVKIIA